MQGALSHHGISSRDARVCISDRHVNVVTAATRQSQHGTIGLVRGMARPLDSFASNRIVPENRCPTPAASGALRRQRTYRTEASEHAGRTKQDLAIASLTPAPTHTIPLLITQT